MRVADPSLTIAPNGPMVSQRGWRILGGALIGIAAMVLGLRLIAFDQIVALAASFLSGDGEISARNRGILGGALIEVCIWCTVLAGVALAMGNEVGRARLRSWFLDDVLETGPGSVPDPLAMMMLSAAVGISIVSLYVLKLRTSMNLEWLFAKEGTLELLTFALLMVGALWCGLAAKRLYREHRWAALAQGALALSLFLVAMEEISWGQTYLAWRTPDAWAAINSQQETTLHNLLTQQQLHDISQLLTFGFVAVALFAVCIGRTWKHPFVQMLAPHASMAPVLLLIAYAAGKYHLEISEILFAIFIACYSWRIYLASRTPRAH